jgi:DNA-binding GntR family transcriptional regulator
MLRRDRYPEHCRQHLHILDLLEQDRNADASAFMREHLEHTLRALAKIEHILQPHGAATR